MRQHIHLIPATALLHACGVHTPRAESTNDEKISVWLACAVEKVGKYSHLRDNATYPALCQAMLLRPEASLDKKHVSRCHRHIPRPGLMNVFDTRNTPTTTPHPPPPRKRSDPLSGKSGRRKNSQKACLYTRTTPPCPARREAEQRRTAVMHILQKHDPDAGQVDLALLRLSCIATAAISHGVTTVATVATVVAVAVAVTATTPCTP